MTIKIEKIYRVGERTFYDRDEAKAFEKSEAFNCLVGLTPEDIERIVLARTPADVEHGDRVEAFGNYLAARRRRRGDIRKSPRQKKAEREAAAANV